MPTDTYKVVLGDRTIVKKVVIGTPLDNVTINQYADIDNLVGVDTTGKSDGDTLVYDSASGNFVTTRDPVIEVDGRFYPSDSAHTNILIRRSGTAGQPIALQQGELAYSFLEDPLTDGFGNGGDRLYIATGENVNGNSTQIDVIGGKYFTDLLNHQQGKLTANSAILTDEFSKVDKLLADSATVDILRVNNDGFIDVTHTRVITPTPNEDAVSFVTTEGITVLKTINQAGVEIYHNKPVLEGQPLDTSLIFTTQETGALFPLNVTIDGRTFTDSVEVDGDIVMLGGNLTQTGVFSQQNVETWQTTARFLSLKTDANASDLRTIDSAGIKVGSPNNPLAYIKYKYRMAESDCWDFSDGICAPKIEVERFDFETIDCGIYA